MLPAPDVLRDVVAGRFSSRQMAQAYTAIYQRLVSGRHAAPCEVS